jgi:hypothetical protein
LPEAGAEFFFNQKYGMTLKEATLHMVNLKEGFGKKNTILSLALTEHFQEFDIACSVKACLITHKSF